MPSPGPPPRLGVLPGPSSPQTWLRVKPPEGPREHLAREAPRPCPRPGADRVSWEGAPGHLSTGESEPNGRRWRRSRLALGALGDTGLSRGGRESRRWPRAGRLTKPSTEARVARPCPPPAPRPPALSASTLSHQALGEVGPAPLGRRAACHAPFVLTSTFPHLLARGTLHSTPALGLCYIFLFVYEFCISKPTALPAHAAAGGP